LVSKKKFLKLLGAHVRSLREAKELTQTALSNKMDKDAQSLQRVERGAINPSIFYLYELAEALDIDLVEIVDFKK
jgi:putative transcriptional regulator